MPRKQDKSTVFGTKRPPIGGLNGPPTGAAREPRFGSAPAGDPGNAPSRDAAPDFTKLVATIKRALRARGITYRALGQQLGMSESGVKKMLGGEDCSFRRLTAVAEVLDVSLADLLEHSRHETIRELELSEEQQRYFVVHLDCFAFYWKLVIEGLTVHQIEQRHRVPKRRAQRYLSALDDLGLVSLEPGERVRIRDSDLVRWSDSGPLMDLLNRRFSTELLEHCLRQPRSREHLFRLHYLALRPDTATELHAALETLIDEFRRRAHREALTTRPDALRPVSLLVAAAPRSFIEEV